MEKFCLNCNNKLTKKYQKKFCSHKCDKEYKHNHRIKRYCKQCGNILENINSQKKFCSQNCSAKYNNKHRKLIKIERKPCPNCGSTYRKNAQSKYCNKKCYLEHHDKILIKDTKQDNAIKARIINNTFNVYLKNALNKKLQFELSKDDVAELIFSKCIYCGSSGRSKMKYNEEMVYYNGIDRVDNNLGYIKSNCASCCSICNKAKLTLKYDVFMNWIKDVVNFNASMAE